MIWDKIFKRILWFKYFSASLHYATGTGNAITAGP